MANLIVNQDFTDGGPAKPVGWKISPTYWQTPITFGKDGELVIPGNALGKLEIINPVGIGEVVATPGAEITATMTASKTSTAERTIGIGLYSGSSVEWLATQKLGIVKQTTTLTATVPENTTGKLIVIGATGPTSGSTGISLWPDSELYVSAPQQPITPPVPEFGENTYTLPDVAGVEWLVNGEAVEPGTHEVDTANEAVTVEITMVALDGYVFDSEPGEYSHTFPKYEDPPVDVPGWPDEITDGGRLVGRWLGRSTDDELHECSMFHNVALFYVWGYTRGRGFTESMDPNAALQRVIVAAAARLAYNPELIISYTSDNQSERMTVFNGFNLAEQNVLNIYRKRFA